jgi:putative membrane protein
MILKKITSCITVLGLTAALTSACSNEKDAKEVAEEVNEATLDKKEEKGAEYLVEAYSGNMYEIKASENAALNASTAEVKKLATMMIEAHGKMNLDIETLAASKAVTLPNDLTDEQRKDLEKLTEKTGIDYDKAFVSKMKDKHEDALSMLNKVSEKCDDADIKTWAQKTAPAVSSHLEMVKSADENLKNK